MGTSSRMPQQEHRTDASETLTICLFGTLEVHSQTGAIAVFHSTRPGQLLAYLALQPQNSHLRQIIANRLWLDSDSGSFRTRLRQELAVLRRELRSHKVDDTLLLETAPNTIRLRSGVITDVQQYRNVIKQAQHTDDPSAKLRLLLEAASLYRAPLLVNFNENWLIKERKDLAHCHAQAMTELAELQQAQGHSAAAVETMRRLLDIDPLHEESHMKLMRLYAAMGQPTQVLIQYQLLETAFREANGQQPSAAAQHLAQELREQAALNASGSLFPRVSPFTQPDNALISPMTAGTPVCLPLIGEVAEIADDSGSTIPYSPAPRPPSFSLRATPQSKSTRCMRRCLAVACAGLLALAGGWFGWNYLHRPNPSQLVWVAEYHAQEGEKENSEATDVVVDEAGNVYVCGFIQTETEDVDFLVLKYSPDGKLLWKNRYTSPEHDCDRAFSLVVDKGSVFVAGETHVPDSPKTKGGWHLVTVKFDAEHGIKQWERRAMHHRAVHGRDVSIIADGFGGIYTGDTERKPDGTLAMLVLHYDNQGNLLWTYNAPPGTRLSDIINIGQDSIVLGGDRLTATGQGENTAVQDALLVYLSFTGKERWQLPCSVTDKNTLGERAVGLGKDAEGNVYVSGGAELSSPGAVKQAIWLAKLNTEGRIAWLRTFAQNASFVPFGKPAVSGDRVYLTGELALPHQPKRLVALAYDFAGNRQWVYSICRPNDPRSTGGGSIALLQDTPIFGATIHHFRDNSFQEQDGLLQAIHPDGSPLRQIHYDTTPSSQNDIKSLCSHYDLQRKLVSLYAIGQRGKLSDTPRLTVLKYQPE
jgi:DNA-binding SARP family transcriptional activator